MSNSYHHGGWAALLALLLFLALAAVSHADGTCFNELPQPSLDCASAACAAPSGLRISPLPRGETYASFYSWVRGLLGTDGGDVNYAYVNSNTTDPTVRFASNQTNCYVNVTFAYEATGYRNRLGAYMFNSDSSLGPSTPLFDETTVDCTRSDGGSCLTPGSTLTLGPFSSSQSVGFYLDQNQVCDSNASRRLYSSDAFNMEAGFDSWRPIPRSSGRAVAVVYDPNTKRVVYGWEDSPEGPDSDYNDVVFTVTSNCALDYGKIPCAGVTTCRNTRQLFIHATCECFCLNQTSCRAPKFYDTDLCACACPATTCNTTCPIDSQTCQCTCPPSPTPSRTPSSSPTPSVSASPSATPSNSPSNSPTPSNTRSPTPTSSPTRTPSITPTSTPTISNTPSNTPTRTPTPSRTPSSTPSSTPTISNTPSNTPSRTPTPSNSPTPSVTPTHSNTPTPSVTPTSSNSPTPSNTPTPSASPSSSLSPTSSPSSSSSPSPSTSASPTPSASTTPSPTPSCSVSATPSSSSSPSSTSSPSASPTPSRSSSPSSTRTPSPSPTPSISASPSRSPAPSSVASAYNVLLVGRPDVEFDFDMSNGQVDGRVAVNGGFRARSFGIGSRVTPCDSSTAALVVGGASSKIDFQQGGLQCGNLVADASTRVIALPGFNNGNNRLVLGNVFNLTRLDFNAEAARAQATADAACSAGGVAGTVSPWREITFQGVVGATEQRFTVEARDLNQASSARFVFAQPSTVAKVVVAVRGGQTSGLTLSNFGINNGGVSGARMTFVVCEAARVTLRGFGLDANLLAVDSQVTLENGQITGKIIAQTLSGSGGIRLP